ncbi:MAG: acetamidase/formamidase family protein [Thermoplasmata archaeon]|nr:acetamidase/formamidase family protein [Thermoplasmata archaeon]
MRVFDGRQEAHLQFAWEPGAASVFSVDPGEEFIVELHDSSTGQLGPSSRPSDLHALDMGRVDAVAGPVEVRGARPGDAVDVELLEIRTASWGWTGVFREFGFLAQRFDDDLVIWAIEGEVARPLRGFLRPVEIALAPMLGVIGVAPESGRYPLIPPQRFGGNMDHRWHRRGSVVRLPVYQTGAMLGFGDPHAAQGDGELCGTGIETPATARVRIQLRSGGAPPAPRVVSRGPPPPVPGDCWTALGVAPSMEEATRMALDNLLDWLVEGGWTAKEGYVLASLLGNLRLAEVVDLPNVVVALDFPAPFAQPPSREAPGWGEAPRAGLSPVSRAAPETGPWATTPRSSSTSVR